MKNKKIFGKLRDFFVKRLYEFWFFQQKRFESLHIFFVERLFDFFVERLLDLFCREVM